MFMLYGIVAGIVAGYALGGRLGRLGDFPLRWPGLALIALAAQLVLFLPGVGEALGVLAPWTYVASTAAVLLVVVRNVRLPGLALVATGGASNLAAIVANGGYMPASPNALAALGWGSPPGYSNSALVANPALAPLTDLFALPGWLPFANVFSIGDAIIGVGVAIAVAWGMRPRAAATRTRP